VFVYIDSYSTETSTDKLSTSTWLKHHHRLLLLLLLQQVKYYINVGLCGYMVQYLDLAGYCTIYQYLDPSRYLFKIALFGYFFIFLHFRLNASKISIKETSHIGAYLVS